jgi:hypothetical protein
MRENEKWKGGGERDRGNRTLRGERETAKNDSHIFVLVLIRFKLYCIGRLVYTHVSAALTCWAEYEDVLTL